MVAPTDLSIQNLTGDWVVVSPVSGYRCYMSNTRQDKSKTKNMDAALKLVEALCRIFTKSKLTTHT